MSIPTLSTVSRSRLADDLWALVNVPSPTTRERRVAFVFADLLRGAGADVELDETIPESPNVIGRLRGTRGTGPTLQLAGHLDHIDVEHAAPERSDQRISGRGAADMKNGLAGVLEIVRVLSESGAEFAGEILVTAYGLHEAPLGDGRGLFNLMREGVHGDAAIVFESPERKVYVTGKGQSIWNIRVTRPGEVCHELRRPPAADDLIETVNRVVGRLLEYSDALAEETHDYPLLGPQSLFVGQIHYGDFYNRVPVEAFLQGTRRWHPNLRFADVKAELDEIVATVARPPGIGIEQWWSFVGDSYAFDPGESIVRCLRNASRHVIGAPFEIAGCSTILDVNRIVPVAGIPAVSVGLDTETAHADHEFVRLDLLEEGCRIALQAVLNYLNVR